MLIRLWKVLRRRSLCLQHLSAIKSGEPRFGRDRGTFFLALPRRREDPANFIFQVIVAYFIEASLLALSLIMFGIKFITDYVKNRRNKTHREMLDAHEAAVLASTGVFLDTSVYFALSICFAAIIFNYRDKPLLYEDSMYFQFPSWMRFLIFASCQGVGHRQHTYRDSIAPFLRGHADSGCSFRTWPSLNVTYDKRTCGDHAFIVYLC